jgi:pyruvate, water dikinase
VDEPEGRFPDVLWLDDPRCIDRRSAGGKGAALARMLQEGLAVPHGFVVPVHVLERQLGADGRHRALACDQVAARRLVCTAVVPPAALEAACSLGTAVAVRSSGVAEDSASSSHAGRQDSFLDVKDAESVRLRILDCWASNFSEGALSSRAQAGSLDEIGIAVVVQAMVVAETSGILFTVDPVGGYDQMRVEAIRGSADALTSGRDVPQSYVIRRDGSLLDGPGGTDWVLDARALKSLVALGRRLEEQFGAPQDIEWAIADRLYVLQSRPITTL